VTSGGFGEAQARIVDGATGEAAYDPTRDEMVEIVTLPEKRTGVRGTIFVSTRMAERGPRIKWWPGRPERDGACLVVKLETAPRVINLGLPPRTVPTAEADPVSWALLNRDALLQFWDGGAFWLEEEVSAFLDGLRKRP
jgi:hypothetical protein